MWLILGSLAIAVTLANLLFTCRRKKWSWLCTVAALSLTAFTICSLYTEAYQWVEAKAVSTILDVMPTMSWMIWVLTGGSVLLNGLAAFLAESGKKN